MFTSVCCMRLFVVVYKVVTVCLSDMSLCSTFTECIVQFHEEGNNSIFYFAHSLTHINKYSSIAK